MSHSIPFTIWRSNRKVRALWPLLIGLSLLGASGCSIYPPAEITLSPENIKVTTPTVIPPVPRILKVVMGPKFKDELEFPPKKRSTDDAKALVQVQDPRSAFFDGFVASFGGNFKEVVREEKIPTEGLYLFVDFIEFEKGPDGAELLYNVALMDGSFEVIAQRGAIKARGVFWFGRKAKRESVELFFRNFYQFLSEVVFSERVIRMIRK